MKTFSNLYSAIKHGRNIIIRPKWKPNVPGHNYYVSKNGRVYRYLGDFKWVRISVYSDGKPDSYLSVREIANILPIHISSVRRILKGKGLIKYKDKFCYVNKQQK